MQDGGISYRATVDGVTVACQFTWEALQDVNPEFTLDQPINQFNFSAERLLAIAEKKIRNGGIVNEVVLVNTGDL
ncbi:MAG: hypothetical protein DI561_02005 [Thauera sp.]|nr:MAG: hypothetical protein DI561_02005 [Thauera sp.]